MIFSDFARALAQMTDSRFLRVLLMGVGLTLLLLVLITIAFASLVGWITPDTLTLWGEHEITWVGDFFSIAAVLAMMLLSVFLMVPVASAFTGFFLEDVAAAVEARHYPDLPQPPRIGFHETLRDSLNFFGVLVAVNVVALLLYFVVGPFAPILFWVVNGYLLGREYFQMVAMRRLGRQGATRLRKRYSGQVWLAGLLMAVPLSLPLINLFIPVLGAATFTHLFHRLAAAAPSGGTSRNPAH